MCASNSADCKIRISQEEYTNQEWRPNDPIPNIEEIDFEVIEQREKYFLLPSTMCNRHEVPFGEPKGPMSIREKTVFSTAVDYRPNRVNIIHCEIISMPDDNNVPLDHENPDFSKKQLKKMAHVIREEICLKALKEEELSAN